MCILSMHSITETNIVDLFMNIHKCDIHTINIFQCSLVLLIFHPHVYVVVHTID
jgi:hypothetical protein